MSRVSLVRCEDYNFDRVLGAVKRAFDLIGGIGAFVQPGSSVLLKPNLLSARPPEEGVDTHPAVVKAVARLAREAGGRVSIGDSPGGYGKNVDEVYEISGMAAVAREEGAELVRFTSNKNIEGFPIATCVLNADCLISIPKLKTHYITTITAGVKNVFGTLTGVYKAECHSRAPKEEDLAKIIGKVYSLVRPKVTVLDAVVAMEGNGPAAGSLRNMSFIMAGPDAVAIDSLVSTIIGLAPLDIATTKQAYKEKAGEANLNRIALLGDSPASFVVKDFRLPFTTKAGLIKLMPKTVLNALASFIRFRPVIDAALCRRCNLCKISCPVEAMTIEGDKCRIDYKKCIRCLCCAEICPYGAVSVRCNHLTRLIWGR